MMEAAMEQSQTKNFIHDFTSGPVLPALLTFAVPLFLSNQLQAVYNLVDMIVVGRVVGAPGLSASPSAATCSPC